MVLETRVPTNSFELTARPIWYRNMVKHYGFKRGQSDNAFVRDNLKKWLYKEFGRVIEVTPAGFGIMTGHYKFVVPDEEGTKFLLR